LSPSTLSGPFCFEPSSQSPVVPLLFPCSRSLPTRSDPSSQRSPCVRRPQAATQLPSPAQLPASCWPSSQPIRARCRRCRRCRWQTGTTCHSLPLVVPDPDSTAQPSPHRLGSHATEPPRPFLSLRGHPGTLPVSPSQPEQPRRQTLTLAERRHCRPEPQEPLCRREATLDHRLDERKSLVLRVRVTVFSSSWTTSSEFYHLPPSPAVRRPRCP
jgi:hypothetical protein